MKKKGFTLIELLTVILILGIIVLIAIPTVNKILTEARKVALDGNNLTTITIPSTVEIIEKDGINKRSNGNRTLTTIINKTGKSFDWSTITGSLTPNQSFETGTISHNYGNINVTK